jgi:seryl-tRNA synthetase
VQGVNIPEPLRKYLPGAPEFIPFTKEVPKGKGKADATAKPKAAKPADAADQVADKLKDAKV